MIKRVPIALSVSPICPVSVEFPDRQIPFMLLVCVLRPVAVTVTRRISLTVLIDPEEV